MEDDKLYSITIEGTADELEAIDDVLKMYLDENKEHYLKARKVRVLKMARIINKQMIRLKLNHWLPSFYDDIEEELNVEGDV